MSKVDELRAKYPNMAPATFNKLVGSDETPTKKYSEFLLKTWTYRQTNGCPNTIAQLVDWVQQFDKLLPYITTKDIYSKDYSDFSFLKLVVAKAEEIKDEKTFVKDDHVVVLDETDEYIMIQPITHRGSLRYGAQTKWCTASKRDTTTFNRYTKGGLLVYLIDKLGNKAPNYKKVALYLAFSEDVFTSGLNIFNANDSNVYGSTLLDGGWKEEEVIKITTMFNMYFLRERKLKKSKDYVQSFSDNLGKLNFETLAQHIALLGQNQNFDYTSNIQEQIDTLVKNLNDIAYARFTKA